MAYRTPKRYQHLSAEDAREWLSSQAMQRGLAPINATGWDTPSWDQGFLDALGIAPQPFYMGAGAVDPASYYQNEVMTRLYGGNQSFSSPVLPHGFYDSPYAQNDANEFIKRQQLVYGAENVGWQPDGSLIIGDESDQFGILQDYFKPMAIMLAGPALAALAAPAAAGLGAAEAAGAGAANAALASEAAAIGSTAGLSSAAGYLGTGALGATPAAAAAAGTLGGSGSTLGGGMFDWWDAVMPEWSAGNYAPVTDLSAQLGLTSGTPFAGPTLPNLGNLAASLTGSGAIGNLVGGLSGIPTSLIQSLLGGGGGGLSGGGLLGGGGDNSLLGAILGGALGALGAGDEGETTVTKAPWGPQQPYLLSGFNQAQNLLSQQQGYNNPLLDPATNQLQSTIQGDYLNPESNPYLSGAVDTALDQAAGRVNSQFAGEDYGGSAHQEWLGRTLADTALPYYYGNYQTERGRQLGTAAGAPAFTQGYYGAQASPLNNYMNLVGQGYGSQITEPYAAGNPWLTGLGGAAVGSQLFGGLFG